jgi:hypothetical protein
MTRAFVAAAILGLLLLAPAHAATALFKGENPGVEKKRICYYEFDGLTYHYVIPPPTTYLTRTRCAPSLELPFAHRPEGWGVLLMEETEVHAYPERLCYYASSGQKIVVRRQTQYDRCDWLARLLFASQGSGVADRIHEELIPGTETRLCLYGVNGSRTPTHYRTISKHHWGGCPAILNVP